MSVLEKIVETKRGRLLQRKSLLPLREIRAMAADAEPLLDFRSAISRPDGKPLKLIAELKKASPSKGLIRPDFDVESLSLIYRRAGASALSVLTEEDFFQGSIEFLPLAKKASGLPVLRKDFIFDEYQIYEARAYGADAILLIGASLERGQIEELSGLAGELGIAVLHEVHNEEDLEVAISVGQRIIGINNRDLTTLKIDLNTTKKLLPYIPKGVVSVSESGITTPEDVIELNSLQVDAVLVGTSLMAAEDVGAKIREVFGKIWYNG